MPSQNPLPTTSSEVSDPPRTHSRCLGEPLLFFPSQLPQPNIKWRFCTDANAFHAIYVLNSLHMVWALSSYAELPPWTIRLLPGTRRYYLPVSLCGHCCCHRVVDETLGPRNQLWQGTGTQQCSPRVFRWQKYVDFIWVFPNSFYSKHIRFTFILRNIYKHMHSHKMVHYKNMVYVVY